MLATDWLSDVSQCLEDTLEAGNHLLEKQAPRNIKLLLLTKQNVTNYTKYVTGELDETDDIGVSLVEELLTDFLQLIHGTIRNLIPAENDESDDENDRAVQNTVRYKFVYLYRIIFTYDFHFQRILYSTKLFIILISSGSTRDGANDPSSTNPNNPLLKRGPGKDFCLFFLHFLLFKPSVFFYHILTQTKS